MKIQCSLVHGCCVLGLAAVAMASVGCAEEVVVRRPAPVRVYGPPVVVVRPPVVERVVVAPPPVVVQERVIIRP